VRSFNRVLDAFVTEGGAECLVRIAIAHDLRHAIVAEDLGEARDGLAWVERRVRPLVYDEVEDGAPVAIQRHLRIRPT
jgi:hypothetical protein